MLGLVALAVALQTVPPPYLPIGTFTVSAGKPFEITVEQDSYNTDGYYLVVDDFIVQTLNKGSAQANPELPAATFHHTFTKVGLYRLRVEAFTKAGVQDGYGAPVIYREVTVPSVTVHVYATYSPLPAAPVKTRIIRY